MEIELFKVYELNEYGKGILHTDKIFVAKESNIKDALEVVYENENQILTKQPFDKSFIAHMIVWK